MIRYFNYSLYNNPYLFNLNYVSSTNVMDNVIHQYSTSLYNLNAAIANKSNSLLVLDKDYSLLPMAVRHVSSDSTCYIIERPPFQIPVDFSVSKSYKHRKTVKALNDAYVWVPWSVSKISVTNHGIQFELYFNDKSIDSVSDYLIPCYFPNCSSGAVCMGQDSPHSVGLTPDSSILDLYNFYFNSYFAGWNSDLGIQVQGLDYFDDIKDDLVSTKNAPSNLERFIDTNGYRFTNTETHKNFIYLMSKLDLNTTLGFVSHLKNLAAKRYGDTGYRHEVQNIIKHSKPFSLPVEDFLHSNSYYYMRQVPGLLESYGSKNDSKSFSSIRTNVTITNYPNTDDFILRAHIDNPFIISQVYLNHFSKKDDTTFNHNITLDYSLIEPYIVLNDRHSDVNAN